PACGRVVAERGAHRHLAAPMRRVDVARRPDVPGHRGVLLARAELARLAALDPPRRGVDQLGRAEREVLVGGAGRGELVGYAALVERPEPGLGAALAVR